MMTTMNTGECPECGSQRCEYADDPERYEVRWRCPDCGHEGRDGYENLYGVMAVPWGFLL